MLLGKKKEHLAEKDKSGTPKLSRSVVPFDKYVTAKDQIELVLKDIEGGFKFACTRLRLSGGEQRGVLVVGVTALSYLNTKEKIVFCHPYRLISSYRVNAKGLLEYSLEVEKGKNLIYLFETSEPSSIVTAIDRNSLRLEKVIAAGNASPAGSSSVSGPKSPRGGRGVAPFVDNEAMVAAAATGAPIVTPKTKIGDIGGMRFNVKVSDQRVVAILNEDGILLIDPSAVAKGAAGTQSMACQRFPWSDLLSVTAGEKSVTLKSSNDRETVIVTPDARSLLEEINRQAGLVVSNLAVSEDKTALALGSVIRLSALSSAGNESEAERGKGREFSPGVFARLRRHWHVSDTLFSDEWSGDQLRREAETPGASRSRSVVRSKSGLMLATEVSASEAAALQRAAEQYSAHMTLLAPQSLLPRLLGLYLADGAHFVVAMNPIPQQCPVVFTTYDLSPSSQRVAPPAARGKTNAHLLEKDFLLDHRTVFCSFRAKKTLLLQLAQDAAFLVKAGFSDFVLQVSVAAVEETQLSAVRSWLSAAESAPGICLSPLSDELFVVQVSNLATGAADESFAQKIYNFAKKRVFSSPDPTPADLLYEKMLHEQVQSRLQNANKT